jgi:hypothetical protein
MPQFETLEEYAEHIRRTTTHLTAELFGKLGTEDPTALRVALLCEEAAEIVTGRQMEQEQAEVLELDLAKLPPVFADGRRDPFGDE